MRKLYLFAALLVGGTALKAQTAFVDAMYDVSEPTTMVYGENYNLIAENAITPLTMDVYTPVGDEEEVLRPVVVLFHTGNFLPQYFNGSPYGGKNDSVNIEIISSMVERGYVGISADYRQGWQPTAQSQSVRTGTLLQAVYRASQDAHALSRYLRKTVAEDGNPMVIDTSKIMFLGIGSGGYLVNAFNFLDSIEQIEKNLQFLDDNFEPLVDTASISNPDGTQMATNHVVNHSGYNSEVALTVNIGGALGDTLWMDGDEAPVISIHSATDPFAPYYAGTVIVPTNPPMPVVDVQGSRLMVEMANDMGINDILEPATAMTLPDMFDPLSSQVNQIIAAYEQIPFQSPLPTNTDDQFMLGEQNLWTVLRRSGPDAGAQGTTGVWNWFDEAALRAQVAAINQAIPNANLSADAIVNGETQTNPQYANAEKAKANIDTIMAFIIPRAYYALDLENLTSGAEDLITNASVALELFPNPTGNDFTVRVADNVLIRRIDIFDMQGRRVVEIPRVDQSSYTVNRGNLSNGEYVVQLHFDEGTTARKLMLR